MMVDGSELINADLMQRTDHIKSLCHEAETVGIETVMTLADQGEQLKTINSHLSTIDTTLVDTHQHINRLKGMTQRFIDTVRLKLDRKLRWKGTKEISKFISRRRPTEVPSKRLEHQLHRHHSLTDETFNDMECVLHRLRDLAQDINDQLVGQAETMGEIHQHMIISTHRIEEQNGEISKII